MALLHSSLLDLGSSLETKENKNLGENFLKTSRAYWPQPRLLRPSPGHGYSFSSSFLGHVYGVRTVRSRFRNRKNSIPLVPLPAHKFPVARVQNPIACGAKFTLRLEAVWSTLIC